MASPHAAAVAALVLKHFPGYNADQVAQRVRVTADNIDALADYSATVHDEKTSTQVSLFGGPGEGLPPPRLKSNTWTRYPKFGSKLTIFKLFDLLQRKLLLFDVFLCAFKAQANMSYTTY